MKLTIRYFLLFLAVALTVGISRQKAWADDPACDADCVNGLHYCQAHNYDGFYNGPYVQSGCAVWKYGGVTACEHNNCQ